MGLEEGPEAKAEAEKETGTHHVHRWVTARQWSGGVLSGVEEGPDLGGYQNSHGLQPGGLRLRVRRSCKGNGIGVEKADHSGADHDHYRRSSSHQTDSFGRTGSRPAVHAPG